MRCSRTNGTSEQKGNMSIASTVRRLVLTPSRCFVCLALVCMTGCVSLQNRELILAESIVLDRLVCDYIAAGGTSPVCVDGSSAAIISVAAKYRERLKVLHMSPRARIGSDYYNIGISGVNEPDGVSVRVFAGRSILVYHLRRECTTFAIYEIEQIGIF